MVKITNTHGYTLKTLRQREKRTRLARMRLRIMAVRLVWEDYPATAVADILGMTAETVSSYVVSWNRGGLDALIPGKSSGQPTKIPPELTADIRAALQQTPWAVGYGEATNWDTRIFQSFLRDQYQIVLSRSGCTQWLHRHGFSWTRPTYVLAKANLPQQKAWVEGLQELKKTNRGRPSVI